MKRATILFAAILLLAVAATAQNPKLSYSAVVRNSANELVANQQVAVAVSIANSEIGAAVYSETHSNVQTNQNGLLTLTIGDGTVVGGDLADVDWRTAHITTQYTLPDGSSLVSTMPVNAVPYALYADNISPEAILGAVSAMTDEQKAALKEALGVTGGGEEPAAFTCGTSKMVDADGNQYETVQIGTQCWTKTNLRTTKDKDGHAFIDGISAVAGSFDNVADSVVYIPTEEKWSENNSAFPYDEVAHGYYYNWKAANQACPSGWHLPSDDEWTAMQVYVSTAKDAYGNYLYRCEGDSTYIARALATGEENYWYSGDVSASYPCEPEYDLIQNNGTGFSVVPAGYWYYGFYGAGGYAYFWSSTEYGASYAWGRYLYYGNADVYRNYYTRRDGFSVRCLRD